MSNELCWNCQNACGGCSWSRDFTPVEGWTAIPSQIRKGDGSEGKDIDTYHVMKCPQLVPDVVAYAPRRKAGRKPLSDDTRVTVRAMRKQGKKYIEIQSITGLSKTQIGRILKQSGMTDAARRVSLKRRSEIKELLAKGYSKTKITEMTGVSSTTILKIERE